MPLNCNGGAALRLAPVKGPGPKLRNEFCRQVCPSQVRYASGPHEKPARCQRTTVSGVTRRACFHHDQSRRAITQTLLISRSTGVLANHRKYILENPATMVKHFNELRDRPIRRMLTVNEEQLILEVATHLRVVMILLSQTGGRTYSEGFSLRWDQVDLENKLIRLGNDVKTPGSSEPVPLSEYACDVLRAWNKHRRVLLSSRPAGTRPADLHG